jgi:hypothetical protein
MRWACAVKRIRAASWWYLRQLTYEILAICDRVGLKLWVADPVELHGDIVVLVILPVLEHWGLNLGGLQVAVQG